MKSVDFMVSIPALFAAAIFAAADEHLATATLFKTDVVCLKQRSAFVTGHHAPVRIWPCQ
jgi:hypothetical protein